MSVVNSNWEKKLGQDHIVELDLIGQVAGPNISSPAELVLVTDEGFEAGSRYIPGRNLIILSLSASVAFRRGIRTLICGVSETEYSGYPDCRQDSIKAIEAALNAACGMKFAIETPLMRLNKRQVWELAEELGGQPLVEVIREHTHSCYAGVRDTLLTWGYGCGHCPACELRQKGWNEFSSAHV
jgi:7-cyano-7-deazaguanine synthase